MKQMLVVGGANVDLVGIPDQPLRMRDSNPGKVRISFGGVGRNIAHNAALAGAQVNLATVFGNDLLGRSCYDDCVRNGISMEHTRFCDSSATSTYMAVLDCDKDMHVGINDMDILDELDAERIKTIVEALDKEDICVLDTNLNEKTLEILSRDGKCIFALDPISTYKAIKAKAILHRFAIVKPNLQQAEILLDSKIDDDVKVCLALKMFLKIGVKEIIISLGERGIAATDGKIFIKMKMHADLVVNATGAGDCLLGCYLAERLRNDDFAACLEYALAASVMTIGSEETVNPHLNDASIRAYLSHHDIERSHLE